MSLMVRIDARKAGTACRTGLHTPNEATELPEHCSMLQAQEERFRCWQ